MTRSVALTTPNKIVEGVNIVWFVKTHSHISMEYFGFIAVKSNVPQCCFFTYFTNFENSAPAGGSWRLSTPAFPLKQQDTVLFCCSLHTTPVYSAICRLILCAHRRSYLMIRLQCCVSCQLCVYWANREVTSGKSVSKVSELPDWQNFKKKMLVAVELMIDNNRGNCTEEKKWKWNEIDMFKWRAQSDCFVIVGTQYST